MILERDEEGQERFWRNLGDDATGRPIRIPNIGEIAKHRFRDFGAHVREERCCDAVVAYRDRENYRTVVYCPCDKHWIFTDAAMREVPYILDYFRTCGLEDKIVEPVLNHRPIPGAWAKVLLGFLEES
jgi:hypothetical protein